MQQRTSACEQSEVCRHTRSSRKNDLEKNNDGEQNFSSDVRQQTEQRWAAALKAGKSYVIGFCAIGFCATGLITSP
jgi:hypothetical protein